MLAALALMAPLSLLPFFEHYQGTPHQIAAIKELEDAIPDELLARSASWFQTWKVTGKSQRLPVPYFSQHDNESGQGVRECFSSAAAMLAAFYGAVGSDDQYNRNRERFGDTTSVNAQVDTLRDYGLRAVFFSHGSPSMLFDLLDQGRPVAVGILAKGDFSKGQQPWGPGHWVVVVGYTLDSLTIHDPNGLPDMHRGTHEKKLSGSYVRVDRGDFEKRWLIEGPGSGWMIVINDG